jgi:hypothetical protein
MYRLMRLLLIIFVLLFAAAGTVLAKGTSSPDRYQGQWRAAYWNNTTLGGTPTLVRDESAINHDWGALSPQPGVINVDNFSAQWTQTVSLPAGSYRFTMTVDDGGRLWVNNDLVIDAWREQAATTYTVVVYLQGNAVPIRMEYFEKGGRAVAKLSWERLDAPTYGWRGEYYNNMVLAGIPALVRDDTRIDFDWGGGSPAPGVIATDHFSVRWRATLDLSPGRYRFEINTDDGARLWVNQQLIIDAWRDQAATTYSAEIALSGGPTPVTLEYYENAGLAVAQLEWTLATPPTSNWRGEYYNNQTLSGNPTLIRDDRSIDFNWGSDSPAAGFIGADHFSVRWARTLELTSGRYRFTVTSDDGVRLWVNNQLLIDAWRDQAATTYSGEIVLPGGPVPVRMEYYENAGQAVAQLSWTLFGKPDAAATIVDDTDAGFVKGGSPTGWHTAPEGYGGSLTWTRNNDYLRPRYNWAGWYPKLTAGRYEVSVYIPERYTTTGHAVYWISHADGSTSRIVDQSANGGQWVSLGTYRFTGTDRDYVTLNDATGERRLSRLVAFDAVKWEPR